MEYVAWVLVVVLFTLMYIRENALRRDIDILKGRVEYLEQLTFNERVRESTFRIFQKRVEEDLKNINDLANAHRSLYQTLQQQFWGLVAALDMVYEMPRFVKKKKEKHG